jgi:hypothetical protein
VILAVALNPMMAIMLGLALALAGLALGYVVWRSNHKRFIATHGPTFHRLCDGMHVTRLERWRLQRLANKAGLISPAVLLISRGAFENALVRAAVPAERKWPQRFRGRVFTTEPESAPE